MAPGNAAKVKSRFKCVSKAMQSIKLYSTSTHTKHMESPKNHCSAHIYRVAESSARLYTTSSGYRV